MSLYSMLSAALGGVAACLLGLLFLFLNVPVACLCNPCRLQRWVASRPAFLAFSPEMLDDWLA
jgi:hypothetical protein